MNDYEFWEEYLSKLKGAIIELCKSKNEIYVDLHMHSNYSADGKQTLKEILSNTSKCGFDIIALTDHDRVNAYDELYEYVKDGLTNPLIIPGVEFTTDNREYGNQCHLLQLFINPKDDNIIKDVGISYNAMFNRSKIQFKRLNENQTIKELKKKYKIKISYEEYIEYLTNNDLIPEYDTLCLYLMDKFKESKINTYMILDLLEKYNELDPYEDRKILKSNRYKKLREKYEVNTNNYYNTRFLLSMLAVREVDDDWWDKPSSGSLSVNSYGQLKIEDINKRYSIIFAHPTESSLGVVDELVKNNKNIIGLELNIRNNYENINNFYNIIKKYNLIKTIGSDSHDATGEFYEDMDYYKIDSDKFLEILRRIV